MREITKENVGEVITETTEFLKEVAQLPETFEDYALICGYLRDLARAAVVTEENSRNVNSNLEVVAEILDASQKLFFSCYYDYE